MCITRAEIRERGLSIQPSMFNEQEVSLINKEGEIVYEAEEVSPDNYKIVREVR